MACNVGCEENIIELYKYGSSLYDKDLGLNFKDVNFQEKITSNNIKKTIISE